MTVGPPGGFAAFATVMLRPLRLLVTQVILFGDVPLQIYPPSQTSTLRYVMHVGSVSASSS